MTLGRWLAVILVSLLTVAIASSAPRLRSKKSKGVDAGAPDAALVEAGSDAAADAARPAEVDAQAAAVPTVAPQPSSPPLASVLPSPSATSVPAPVPTATKPFEVRARDVVVLRLHLADGGLSAEERARRANRAIESALADADPESVRVDWRDGRAILFVGSSPLVELTRADAQASGEGSLELYAASAADHIKGALRTEATRSQVMRDVLRVTLVILLAIAAVYVVRKLGGLAYRLRSYLDRHPERIPALRFRSIEVVRPHVLRSALVIGLQALKWMLQLGIVYAWLLFALSRFDATRPYTQRLNEVVVSPISALFTRLATLLPLAVLVGLAVIALALLLRFVALFFASVERKETTIEGLSPELARPASVLSRSALVVLVLVFLAPVVTGNPNGAFSRVGVVAIATLALAAIPLVVSVLLGSLILFQGKLRTGAEVQIARLSGRVLRVTLLETVLGSPAGAQIHVPHLATLWRPLQVLSPPNRTMVVIPVSPLVSQREVVELLRAAAAELGEEPEVELLNLDARAATYRVAVAAPTPTPSRTELLLKLSEVLQAHQIGFGASTD